MLVQLHSLAINQLLQPQAITVCDSTDISTTELLLALPPSVQVSLL